MNVASLLIQLLSGALGGNVAGSLLKQFDLGPVGNSIAGIVGGALGGQMLSLVMPAASAAGVPGAGGLDLASIVSDVAGGGVGGGVLMVIVGLIKSAMTRRA